MTLSRKFHIVFVQRTSSQLDVPFYSELSRLSNGSICLCYLNEEGIYRTQMDPELGVVPDFGLRYDFPVFHYSPSSLKKLLVSLRQNRPQLLVLMDLNRRMRIRLALCAWRAGIPVILRSDNNRVMSHARTGVALWLERFAWRSLFDGLAPVSPLTSEYYGAKDTDEIWPFPYMTDARRYGRNPEWPSMRIQLRDQLGFKRDQFVFLAVAKFSRRENPLGILRAFSYALERADGIGLILIGAGPMEREVRAWHESHVRQNAVLPGYIPYQGLERYFSASDAFVHLPEEGCWEASPQDALVAELGLICSSRTGVGLHFLTGDLREFLVNYDDPEEAGQAMIKLLELRGQIALRFEGAWRKAREEYTVQAVAGVWWKKMQRVLL